MSFKHYRCPIFLSLDVNEYTQMKYIRTRSIYDPKTHSGFFLQTCCCIYQKTVGHLSFAFPPQIICSSIVLLQLQYRPPSGVSSDCYYHSKQYPQNFLLTFYLFTKYMYIISQSNITGLDLGLPCLFQLPWQPDDHEGGHESNRLDIHRKQTILQRPKTYV